MAQEALKAYGKALLDVEALRRPPFSHAHSCYSLRLGRLGGMSKESLDLRAVALQKLKDQVDRKAEQEALEKAEDPVGRPVLGADGSWWHQVGMAMVDVKERFDAICERYELREAAGEVADWLTSGEWDVTPTRVAQRFKMEEEDAQAGSESAAARVFEVFLAWIAQGLDFKARMMDDMTKYWLINAYKCL